MLFRPWQLEANIILSSLKIAMSSLSNPLSFASMSFLGRKRLSQT